MFDSRSDLLSTVHRGTATDLLMSQNEAKSGTFSINSKLWCVASVGTTFALKTISFPAAVAFSAVSLAAYAGSALYSRYCQQVEPTLHCSEKVMLDKKEEVGEKSDAGCITKKVKMHEAIRKVIQEKRIRSEKEAVANFATAKSQLKSNYAKDCDVIKAENPERPGPALNARLDVYNKELKDLNNIHVARMRSFNSLYHERMGREDLRYKEEFDLLFAQYNSETSYLRDEVMRGVITSREYSELQSDVEGKYYDATAVYDLHDYTVAMKEVFRGRDEQVESFDPVHDEPMMPCVDEETQVKEVYQSESFDKPTAPHFEDRMTGFQFKEDQPFQSRPNVMLVDDIDDYEYDPDEVDVEENSTGLDDMYHALHDERAARYLDMDEFEPESRAKLNKKLRQLDPYFTPAEAGLGKEDAQRTKESIMESRALLGHLEELEKSVQRKAESLEDEMDQFSANHFQSSYTDHEYEKYLKMEAERMAEFDRDIEETDARLESRYGVKFKK